MNTRPTYFEQREKIIQAYFSDEIEPFDVRFCFCGTLCDGDIRWARDSVANHHNDFGNYSGVEYGKMEAALFKPILKLRSYTPFRDPKYEDALFEGMCAALDVLKEIHREAGENIEDEIIPVFEKRKLQSV